MSVVYGHWTAFLGLSTTATSSSLSPFDCENCLCGSNPGEACLRISCARARTAFQPRCPGTWLSWRASCGHIRPVSTTPSPASSRRVRLIPGADYAAITLVTGKRVVEARAATGDVRCRDHRNPQNRQIRRIDDMFAERSIDTARSPWSSAMRTQVSAHPARRW